MMISTKGRYALRLMTDIALNEGQGPVSIREIAERQEISDKYLEQIIGLLGKAGLVKSIRGAGGGYSLSDKPENITVGTILRVTEGDLAPVRCMQEGAETCTRESICATRMVYGRVYDAINGVVDHITLRDLMDEARSLETAGSAT